MAEFKRARIQVKQEGQSGARFNVTPLEIDFKPSIQNYEMPDIEEAGKGNYEVIKKKYGALAATDVKEQAKKVKDQRFSLNPLLRDPMAVEKEEQRVIDERVEKGIKGIAQEAKDAAHKEGYEEGLKQGHQKAFEKLQKESQATLSGFDQFLEKAENAKEEIFRANERFLIDLIFKISKMVLLKELEVDREYLTRLASELIARVGTRDNIKIRINTEDAQTIGLLRDGLEKDFGKMKNLNIEATPSVEKGGMQVETEFNAIDVKIDTQLQGLYDSIFGRTSSEGES